MFKADAPGCVEWLEQARRVAALGADFIGTKRPRDLRLEMAGK